jgi:prepilin peptidase CpaA
MNAMHIVPLVALIVVLAISVFTDLTSNRIPNAITLPAIVFAFAWQGTLTGWGGLITAGGGFGIGLAAFLPLYFLGGMGAGDVKLMAATGGLLGPSATVVAVGVTLVIGGAMGLVVLIKHRGIGEQFMLWMPPSLHRVFATQRPPLRTSQSLRFPYAAAIAAGVLVATISAGHLNSIPELMR